MEKKNLYFPFSLSIKIDEKEEGKSCFQPNYVNRKKITKKSTLYTPFFIGLSIQKCVDSSQKSDLAAVMLPCGCWAYC